MFMSFLSKFEDISARFLATSTNPQRDDDIEALHRIQHVALELGDHSTSSRIGGDVGLVPADPRTGQHPEKSVETWQNPLKLRKGI